MYADDFVLLAENEEQLQKGINICQNCTQYFELKANVQKSTLMQFNMNGEKSKYKFKWGDDELPFNGDNIMCIDSYKYLGMEIDKDLTWKKHFEHISKKERSAFNKHKKHLRFSKCQ